MSLYRPFGTSRLEAFSDGVIAVIITIMVLELRPPSGPSFSALIHLSPMFLVYGLSFVTIGIFWNNHHYLMRTAQQITSGLLWANLHLLFWLSLIPFVTAWLGENHTSGVPTAVYGAVLLLSSFAYRILERALVNSQGEGSVLDQALGNDVKGKVSHAVYLAGILVSFRAWWVADVLYAAVAIMWCIPDRRVASRLRAER